MKKYIEFLLEKKKEKPLYEYGCAMLYFDLPDIKEIHKKIDKDDIYDEVGFGLEKDSHLTLLFGILPDKIKSDKEIFDTILEFKIPTLILYNGSIFENDDFDVLKFDVKSKMKDYKKKDDVLFQINKELTDKFPYKTDYPEYHPHSTISYLKKGTGKKYIKILKDLEYEATPTKIEYSKPDKNGSGKIRKSEKI